MAIVLGANQYGKAEVRLLHVSRDGPGTVPARTVPARTGARTRSPT